MNHQSGKHYDTTGRGGAPRLEVPAPEDFVGFPESLVKQSIAGLFEQQVQLHENRLAVKAGDQRLTYRELNRLANRIAAAILSERPFREYAGESAGEPAFWETHMEPAAVLMEQGIDAVAAAFGLLKAGKIYLPVDPADPHTRLNFILQHAPARIILTNDNYAGLAQELAPAGCSVINIDQLGEAGLDHNPALAVKPEFPALLIYTSGSTGEPKGVINSQQNLLYDIGSKTNLVRVSPSDRLSLLSWGTGQATKLIFTALLNGASLHLFNLKREGLTHLADWMLREGITVKTISAPVCRSFLELLTGDEGFPDVRVIRTASDAIYPGDIMRLKQYFGPRCYFVNALASTETGIVCAQVMNKMTTIESEKVPIGSPVKGVDVHLLDEHGQPAAADSAGTLSVRSRYIAHAYWRRPELTSKHFTADADKPGTRVFHSGDLARLRPDGVLEFCGRSDFRVKIRGYQVETGEVEAALLKHDNIAEAIVQACEFGQGEKRLVGYVVPRRDPAPTSSALYRFLHERLSDYMIPAIFIVMESIPLLATGKTNRRALPAPGWGRATLDNEYVAPQTVLEEQLSDIWSEIIGIEKVGINDHFMELGGDSLRAGQVMARVLRIFDVDFPVQVLFELPTVKQLAAQIESRQKNVTDKRKVVKLERRPGRGPWALSSGQKRLWFISQLDPESPAYNMPKLIHFSGDLDIAALSEALEQIVLRHEVLRTNYCSRQGTPEAIVMDSTAVALPLTDLSDFSEEEREVRMQQLILDESLRPFDLEADLKIRCMLFRLATDEFMLLYVTHHIASDGWSRGVLLRELAAHYESFVAREQTPLQALPVQYSDFARWHNEYLETDRVRTQLDYWKDCLAGLPAPLDLPTDRPRPAMQSSEGNSCTLMLSPELLRALNQLAQGEQVTMFMLLLAAFNTLLFRYTGEDDLVVGCPIAGRNKLELEGMIGFFVNSLVMRNDLSGDPTFRELLDRVRKQALLAYENQEVPFEKLVDCLRPDRDTSRNPLFQIIFDVSRPRTPALNSAGVTFRMMEVQRQAAPFDQGWNIAITDAGLRVRVEYLTALFDEGTIRQMMVHYQHLLEDVIVNPDIPISRLSMLDAAEHRQLVGFNPAATDSESWRTTMRLFELRAAECPAAAAVIFREQQLSYNELNVRANQLAHYLRARGVDHGALVGVCMERTLDMVVALLAVLKAGGACVPLDPGYPGERLAYMLADSRIRVLLTQQSLRERLNADDSMVVVDQQRDIIARQDKDNPGSPSEPDDAAYVTYTSGSTGRPKGVVISHAILANLITWQCQHTVCSGTARTLQLAPVSFDVSFQEIFSTLCAGGVLVMAPDEARYDPVVLMKFLAANAIERLYIPFVTLQQLADAAAVFQSLPESLGEIITAGEQLQISATVAAFFKRLGGCVLVNQYGPSETHVVTSYRLQGSPQNWPELPPIGRPVANTKVYILDDNLQLVPAGMSGELHIGGVAGTGSYLHLPELTQQKFIADPFSADPDARLYKSGDLARYRPDGNIEFLGRTDQQVKIRGYRVEPGEIEVVLSRHPAVREAVVKLYEPVSGDRRLAAWLLVEPEQTPGNSQITRFLEGKLPGYMVPSRFLFVDAFPMTPSGKVDRLALALPDDLPSVPENDVVPPRTLLEEAIAAVWVDVLRLESTGIHDNFFEQGGHSLLATQFIARLRSEYSLELSVRALFDFPTIAGLSEYMMAHAAIEVPDDATEKDAGYL